LLALDALAVVFDIFCAGRMGASGGMVVALQPNSYACSLSFSTFCTADGCSTMRITKNCMHLMALCMLSLPTAAISGVFYNNPGPFVSDHPRDAMANAWLVRVKSGENAGFYWNGVKPGCPALTAACKRRGYLLPGDIAVAAYTTGPFTIVEFIGPKGTVSDGAIESRLLDRAEVPKPTPQDWVGHWQDTDERDLVISQSSDPSVLTFLGNATWGAHDPERVKNGAVNLGSFAAYVKPVANWGGFIADLGGEGETSFKFPAITAQKGINTDWSHYFPADAENANSMCRASFRLLGPYLITYTPLYICGGMNVTFTGVYRRISSPHV
jgi:hypothetical protein